MTGRSASVASGPEARPDNRKRRWLGIPRPAAPGVAALGSWHQNLGPDAVAGLAVAAYLVPQVMAYARLAELEPVTGLWAAVPALVLYALLGTSRQLSAGPESASALLVGASVVGLAPSTEERAAVAAALALAVAAVTLVAWVARLGFLADLLSKPVLVGYLAGVAVTMVISQLPGLTGIESETRDTLGRLGEVIDGFDELRAAPFLLGAAIVVLLFVTARVPALPGPLVAVLAATAVTALLDLENRGVATVGDIPSGLSPLAFPGIPASMWPGVFVAAVGIAVVVYSDNILTARAFAARSGDHIDANQELLAVAAANAGAGFCSGFPVSSSASRSALGEAARSRSQLTSLVAAAMVIVVLLAAGPLLESFPEAALSGLVIYAAIRLIDFGGVHRIAAFRPTELIPATAAFVGVVVFDLLVGIGIAVALSVLELFARIARGHDAVQGKVPGLAGLHDIDDYPEAETVPGLVVYRYDGPLCFANGEDFRRSVLAAVDREQEPVAWVLLNMEANVEIDLTACDMLEELRATLERRGIVLTLARVKQDLLVYLRRCGLAERIGEDRMFFTLPTALEAFEGREPRD